MNLEKNIYAYVCVCVCIYKYIYLYIYIGFPGGSDSEESACNAVDPGSIPESGSSPGEGNGYPLQYSKVMLLEGRESETKYVDIYIFLNAWLENSISLAPSATPGMLPRTSLTHHHRGHPVRDLHEGWRLKVGWPAGSLQSIWTWAAGTFLCPVRFLKPQASLLSAHLVPQGGCSLEDSIPALILDLAIEETHWLTE